MVANRLYGAVHFRYDPTSEAAIFTVVGADGSEPVSTTNPLPVGLRDASGNAIASISDPGVGYALFSVSEPVGWQIAEGGITGHESYTGFGYDANIPNTLTDISGRAANIPVPAAAITMQCVSSSANDAGTVVTSGTSTGGTTSTIIDTGKNFVALGVIAGDFLLNDTDVSLGIVVTVDSATQITFQPISVFSYATPKAYRIVRPASTGAALVEHHGLDSNWNENSEFVVLNGTTPVATSKQYIRSNNLHAMVVGTNGAPVGNISLRDNATGTITYNYIAAGLNMSLQAHYTVPDGKVMLLTSWHAGSVGNKSARSLLRGTADFHDRALIPGIFHVNDVILTSNGDVQHRFDLPKRFPAKCDVKISSNTIGAGTSEIGCGFEFWIEDV